MPTDAPTQGGESFADSAMKLLSNLQLEEYIETTSNYFRATSPDSYSMKLLVSFAHFFVGRGQLSEAAYYYRLAILLDTNNLWLRFSLVDTLTSQLDFIGAIEVLDDILSLARGEDRATALYLKGFCLHNLGRLDQALVEYDAALKSAPRHRLARYRRSRLLDTMQGRHHRGLTLVEQATEPMLYARYFAAANLRDKIYDPSFGEISKQHVKLGLDKVTDTSFIVIFHEEVLAHVECCVHDNSLTRFNRPINIYILSEIGQERRLEIVDYVFEVMIAILIANGGHSILVGDDDEKVISQWIQQSYRGGRVVATDITHITVDLEKTEAEIWLSMRKSYRPLINSSRKFLSLAIMTNDNFDRRLISSFRQIHLAYSGPGFDTFFFAEPMLVQHVESGLAEICIGRMAEYGEITASIFVDQNRTTTYWAGRYLRTERGCFSHYPLYEAIMRSRARGMQTFYLGYLGGWEKQNERMTTIAFFKRGFANAIYSKPVWLLTRNR